MGNAVISGILFQPPSPPNALEYHHNLADHNTNNSNPANSGENKKAAALTKKRSHNISVNYLWLYSQNEYKEWVLIPAVHITHNDQHTNTNNSSSISSHKYTLLYSHGNAEDLGLITSFLADLARLLQINVLCYDYSGYGMSTQEECVLEFWKGFGKEVELYKAWLKSESGASGSGNEDNMIKEVIAKNGHKCRCTKEVFVAPMIHPQPTQPNTTAGISGDNNDGGGIHHQEEEDDAYDFTNACGNCTELTSSLEHDTITASNSLHNPAGGNNNSNNNGNGSNKKRPRQQLPRQRLFARHSWTRPSPSETNCYANIQSAYDYLTRVEHAKPQHVILYGKSVGSGPTCWLAQRLCRSGGESEGRGSNNDNNEDACSIDEMCNGAVVVESVAECREPAQKSTRASSAANTSGNSGSPLGGVVLHSPFLSVIRVVLDFGFTTIGDLFPNFDRVGDLTCPVYVIHGSDDTIVPFHHGQTLFQTLPDSSKTVPFWARGAGHNNIEMDMPTAYIKRLQQFIRQCDRLNYPSQLSSGAKGRKMQLLQQKQQQELMLQQSLQASLKQSMQQQQQHVRTNDGKRMPFSKAFRPGITRYASQDSYHLMMANRGTIATLATMATTTATTPVSSSNPSKQRKQKGTLVMRSSPPCSPVPPPPPPAPSSPRVKQRIFASSANVRTSTRPSNRNNGSNFHSGGGGGSMARNNNWAIGAPSQHPLPVQQQQQVLQQQQQVPQQQQVQQQQQQQQYTTNNNHVRYHRSMSTSAVLQSSPPPPSLPPHHSSPHQQGHLQKYRQQQQQRQQQLQQEQHLQYYPQREAYVHSRSGPGMTGWQ